MGDERRQQILTAIDQELRQQSSEDRPGAPQFSGAEGAHRVVVSGEIDLIALATAVDAALGGDALEAGLSPANTNGSPGAGSSPKGAYARADEGKKPEELNASNDE